MTTRDETRWQHLRLAKAVVIVCAIVLAAPLVDMAFRASAAELDAGAVSGGIHADALLAGGDAETALSNIEQRAAADVVAASELPVWFSGEIGLLPGARDLRLSGPVAGYIVDGGDAVVLERLRLHMQQRGWRCVPLGDADGATFLKDGGRCTWALATCTQVGDATSVVIRWF